MTCRHVLGLIDAGPFADYPRAHLDAAWQHARQCPTCGPALEAATALTAGLPALPDLAPPRDLTAAVLARIAEIAPTETARAAATIPEATLPSVTRDWPAWATALGGISAGLAIVLWTPLGGVAPMDIAWLRLPGVTPNLVAIPWTTSAALILAGGLALYVTGLFADVGRNRR
jgi:hypothetical protein